MATFTMEYPPTVNHYWGHVGNRVYLKGKGKAYRSAAMGLTDAMYTGDVSVALYVMFPDRRRRDIDNILKAVLDAIGHAGIYGDDVQVRRLLVEHVGVEAPGWVDVVIEPFGGVITTRGDVASQS